MRKSPDNAYVPGSGHCDPGIYPDCLILLAPCVKCVFLLKSISFFKYLFIYLLFILAAPGLEAFGIFS